MNVAMAKLGLKEMGKFLWKGREKVCPVSFKPKVAIAKFIGKMQKKVWYYEKWVGRHASFPSRQYSSLVIHMGHACKNAKDL